MRKHAGLSIILLTMCLVYGCAFLRQPEARVVTEIVAQDIGYLMARENPKLATIVLEYTEIWDTETWFDAALVIETAFDDWRTWVVARLMDDELLRMSFERLVSLIEIELEGVGDVEERMRTVIPVLRSFAEGIRAGLR